MKLAPIHQLRGFAAFMVLLFHWGGLFPQLDAVSANMLQLEALPAQPDGNLVSSGMALLLSVLSYTPLSPINLGAAGVLVFFLISGFVMPMSLERGKDNFLKKRAIRLLPIVWVSLFMVLGIRLVMIQSGLMSSFNVQPMQFFANGFLVKDLFWQPSIEPAIWTLLVEVKFYILMAIIYHLVREVNAGTFVLAAIAMTAIMGLFSSADPAANYLALLGLPGHRWIFNIVKAITESAPFIIYMLIGSLAYLFYKRRLSGFLTVALTVAFFLAYMFTMLARQYGAAQLYYIDDGLRMVCVFLPIVFFMRRQSEKPARPARFLKPLNAFLNWLGDISYPLYMIHAVFGMTLIVYLTQLGLSQNMAFLLGGGAVFGLSHLLHRFVEKPTNELGRRFFVTHKVRNEDA